MKSLENLTFRQFIANSRVLKQQYGECFTPFFNAELVKCWKKMIYGLQIEEWKRDKIWEYLNDDFPIECLEKLY